MPDDYYVNHKDWPKLIAMTEEVLKLMRLNNEKYDFKKNLEDYDNEYENSRQQLKS